MAPDPVSELLVELEVVDADQAEFDLVTSRLRRDLLEMDVEKVERPPSGRVPAGARAVDMAAIGALLVTVQHGRQILVAVVDRLRDWVARDEGRSVRVTIDGDTIELTGISSDDQKRLIQDWLDRHTGRDQDAGQAQRAPHRDQ